VMQQGYCSLLSLRAASRTPSRPHGTVPELRVSAAGDPRVFPSAKLLRSTDSAGYWPFPPG
jgi:hypothetical protein